MWIDIWHTVLKNVAEWLITVRAALAAARTRPCTPPLHQVGPTRLQLRDVVHAKQAHGELRLAVDDVERLHGARRAARGESVQVSLPKADGVRT